MEGLLQSSAPLPEALQDPEEGQGKTRGAAGRVGGARAEVGVSGAWHDRVRGVVEGQSLGGAGRSGTWWGFGAGRGGNRAGSAAAARCGSSQLARASAAAVAAVTVTAAAAAEAVARAGMRRYLRVVGLCLACGFCSLLYAFSQLAVSLEEGAAGGRRPQAAAMGSWLADGGRGPGRGAGSAGFGRLGRYGPLCRARGAASPRAGRAPSGTEHFLFGFRPSI